MYQTHIIGILNKYILYTNNEITKNSIKQDIGKHKNLLEKLPENIRDLYENFAADPDVFINSMRDAYENYIDDMEIQFGKESPTGSGGRRRTRRRTRRLKK